MPFERRRCLAKTKSGKPCRGGAKAGSDYCGPHQPKSKPRDAPEIAYRGGKLTKVGKRAIRSVINSSMDCHGDGVVYVIKSAEGVRHVKIGCARDVRERLRELQIARPDALEVAGIVVPTNGNALAVEQAAHVIAGRYWIRGEWFALSAERALEAVRLADGAIAAGGSLHQITERLASKALPEDLRRAADRVNADRRGRANVG